MNKEAIKLALQYIEANAETQDELEIAEGLRQAIADLNADYERGFIDGMQKQMQSSVDKAVNAMGKREWVGLTDEDDIDWEEGGNLRDLFRAIEAKLKDKNT